MTWESVVPVLAKEIEEITNYTILHSTQRGEDTGRVDTRYHHYKREETSRAPDCIKREVYPDRYPVAEAAIGEGRKVILFTLYRAILQQCLCVRGPSRRQPRRTVFRDKAVTLDKPFLVRRYLRRERFVLE